jgi:peptidoglycan/LPS O-acetylase OafA/YrhL
LSINAKHLKEIDGLRALAVVSILLYHLDIYWLFPGGFLGVDIFFTISGFLITYILIHEIEQKNHVSLVNFYIKRGKRLLPALFFLLIICLIVSFYVLADTKGKTIRDLLPAIFYYSNWWQIFTDQSYFDQIGRPSLLQHLWSLAIEEQFYLVWPVIFLASYKLGGRRLIAFLSLLLAVLSTLWMGWLSIKHQYPTESDPSRIYLGTDTHSMGLFLGAFTAAIKKDFDCKFFVKHKIYSNLSLFIALFITIVLIYIMQFRLEIIPELYRGGFFLIGILTSSLILIVSVERKTSIFFLSNSLVSYVGKRAYSLYLWHWPIYILVGAIIDGELKIFMKIFLTIIASELSYKYVENPFRFNQYENWLIEKKALYTVLLLMLSLLIGSKLIKNDFKFIDEPNQERIEDDKREFTYTVKRNLYEAKENWGKEKCKRDFNNAIHITPGVQLTVFGDSVMLGVQSQLSKSIIDVDVDAAVGRQGFEGIARVKEYKNKNRLAKIVLVHYGTNGFLNEKNIREILEDLSDRDLVIIMTVYAQRKWQDENNNLLKKLANEYRNTKVLDWHEIVLNNPNILSTDQVHPTQKGIELITMKIKEISNLPNSHEIDSKRRVIPISCKQ